jgi:phospholipid transport system substrate-binding protein
MVNNLILGVCSVQKILSALFLVILSFSGANAATSVITPQKTAAPKDAKAFIQQVSDATLVTIGSNSSAEQKEEKLNKLFEASVDISWMGKFVAGNYWRTAEPAQQQEYADAYKNFLIKTYVPKFKSYTNQQIKILGMESQNDGEYLVQTEIIAEGKPSVKVDYKLRQGAGKQYKIFDIIAEGVSLLTTERSEFSSILSRSGLGSLIEQLKMKASQPAEQPKK